MRKVVWDEPLDEMICKEWISIVSDLRAVTGVSVSRCYFSTSVIQPVLHSFANSTLKAYGAVVFLTQEK